MEEPNPPAPNPPAEVKTDQGTVALARADLSDVEDRLDASSRRYRRHMLWLLLGVSPGAFIPLLYTLSTIGASAALAILGTVIVLESWRAIGARRECRTLEIERSEMAARLEELSSQE